MFGDIVRAKALRQCLVLDGDNHFEGYTNSDGVNFDGGQGGFEIVDSYEGPGTWYSKEDGFGAQRLPRRARAPHL
jgi:hypothetical protein